MSRRTPEVALLHFTLRWEADFAKGFLEDAGIAARVVDHGMGGSGSYTGDLHGGALLVPEARAEEAREVLEAAGVLETEEAAASRPPPLAERSLPPVMRADVDDIHEQLALTKKRAARHGFYAVLGFTPAALIPLTGLVLQGNGGLVAILCLLVVAREVYRWILTGKEVNRLEMLLLEMEDEADEELDGGLLPGQDGPAPA